MSITFEHVCPICRCQTYRFSTHLDLFKNEVEIMKCVNCGHGSYMNGWTNSQLNSIYGVDYAADYLESTETHLQRRAQYVLDLDILLGFVSEEIKVMDFGCSSGEYLDAMPESWIKSGYEVNKELTSILKATRPKYSIFGDVSEIKGCFDVITMRGVIEHIPDHEELIEFLNKQLKIGGLLYISATPDFSAPCAIQYKSNWGQIVAPEHIHQFTPASLQILLSASGLVMKALHHPYLGTPYENWESDSILYLDNIVPEKKNDFGLMESDPYRHPFPGNLMSVFFQKIR
jgi:2-polyprenyl-3-methyl-5-hydroxy-6-metoxy-1,4-benzoquinol methylase